MKLNLPSKCIVTGHEPKPGAVYRSTKGTFMVVFDTTGSGARYLRFDGEGNLSGLGNFTRQWFLEREFLGMVELPNLTLISP